LDESNRVPQYCYNAFHTGRRHGTAAGLYFSRSRGKEYIFSFMKPDLLRTYALAALAIFLSCTWKIKAPDVWTITGTVDVLDSARIAVKDEKVCIGAFDITGTNFAPVSAVAPSGGRAAVDKDGGFSLTIRGEDVQQDYLILAIWYDDNSDGQLDPESERFGILRNLSRDALVFYRNEDDWMDGATREQAKDEDGVRGYITTDVTRIRSEWNIDGTLRGLAGGPGTASVKLRYEEHRLMLGAFPSPSATFTPSLDTIAPHGGVCAVGMDSLFSLSINTNGTVDHYLFIIAWYDADSDSVIDFRSEPYSIVQNSSNRMVVFQEARIQLAPWEWRTATGDTIGDISGVNLYSAKNLVGDRYRWRISGRVAGFSGAEVHVDSNRLKIGAFTKRPPNPLLEGYTVPCCGLESVEDDSTFSLTVDLSPTESLSVWIVLWYDSDNNDTLTPSLEYLSQPQLDTSASPPYLEYRYNRQTSEWLLGVSTTVARDIDSMVLYTKYPLKATVREWTIKGTLEPTGAYSLMYGSMSLRMGAFYATDGIVPSGPASRPDAGWCAIGQDSSFSLAVTPPPQSALKNAYLRVFAWYDVDRDSLLDSLDEPFAPILLPQRSPCTYYYGSSQSSPWHWMVDSVAGRHVDFKEVVDTTFYISKNLVSDRHHWTVNGTLIPDSGVRVSYAEKRLYAGIFACTDTLTARFDTAQAAGITPIGTDSSFSLAVDASAVQSGYMVLVAWYDRDSNTTSTCDSLVDPYSFPMTTGASIRRFFYKYNTQEKEWRTVPDNTTAQNCPGLNLRSGVDLAPLQTSWTVQGKLRPRDNFSVDYAGNRVRFGAFLSNSRTFTPSDSSPVAGSVAVGLDSSFTLNIDVPPSAGGYIALCAWFDGDSDTVLDASLEPWNVPVLSSTSTVIAQYFFDNRSKLWRFEPDFNSAGDTSGVSWYVRRDLKQ
jgi:hypothetical protein